MENAQKNQCLFNAEAGEDIAGVLWAISVVANRLSKKVMAMQSQNQKTEGDGDDA